jgi:hypothetical protein
MADWFRVSGLVFRVGEEELETLNPKLLKFPFFKKGGQRGIFQMLGYNFAANGLTALTAGLSNREQVCDSLR